MSNNFDKVLNRSSNSHKVAGMINKKTYKNDGETLAFTVADMDFPIMPEIALGITEYMKSNNFGYTYPTESYYQAIINHFNGIYRMSLNRKNILPFTGVITMIDVLIRSLTKKDDGIVLLTPIYHPFYSLVNNNRRKLRNVPLIYNEGKYEIDFRNLENSLQKKSTKLLLFCSPHNPIGRVWKKDELEKVVDLCYKHKVLIISDEIHCDFDLLGHTHTVITEVNDKAKEISFVCTSPSKTFNLAAMNCANLLCYNLDLLGKVINFQKKTFGHGVSALGYVSCETSYNNYHKWMNELKPIIEANYKILRDSLAQFKKVTVVPLQGSYLLWIDFSKYEHDLKELFESNNIFITEGSLFGKEGKGFFRINIACPTQYIQILSDRLTNCLNNL